MWLRLTYVWRWGGAKHAMFQKKEKGAQQRTPTKTLVLAVSFPLGAVNVERARRLHTLTEKGREKRKTTQRNPVWFYHITASSIYLPYLDPDPPLLEKIRADRRAARIETEIFLSRLRRFKAFSRLS